MKEMTAQELEALAAGAAEEAAARLHRVLAELAARLDPFPAFLNMTTIQAVELEPALLPAHDRGCVVVCSDGEICCLELAAIPGTEGVSDVEQVERFRPLDLPVEEYIVYALAAIRALTAEVRRRGG